MKCIDVVTKHDVANYLTDIFPVFRHTGIEIQLSGILHKKFRMLMIRVDRRKRYRSFGLCPVRVNPCMKLHAPLVTFVYHPLQRIPLGRFPLYSGQETAPRFISGFIESICFCSYLKDDGIDSGLLQGIEL